MSQPELLIVSNRLPINVEVVDGVAHTRAASGGLITALNSVLQRARTTWIGSMPSSASAHPAPLSDGKQCTFVPVYLSPEEQSKFYCGFSNEIVWPLFHDLQSRCNFDPSYWQMYEQVNQKYADVTLGQAAAHDRIWVHDYHLMLLAQRLRAAGLRKTVAYFHHIPFPSPDIFAKLPWRSNLLRALLDFDLLGFQTQRDRHNFTRCLRQFGGEDLRIRNRGDVTVIETRTRQVTAGAFPISIDFKQYDAAARCEAVASRAQVLRKDLGTEHCILGVDRLDYTKGVPERLRAYGALLEKHPELLKKITLVQLLVPSRVDIPKYQELKMEVEQLVASINGRFTSPGWVPIHYLYRSVSETELLAYYRACDIALVTPLRDGMNLVAKEFCTARVDGDGVLILSEFAGAAAQLRSGALLVNPNDWSAVADAIHQAFTMGREERVRRMRRMRRSIARENVHLWCETFWSCVRSHESPPGIVGALSATA